MIASAVPYAWPYHGQFDPDRTALVACLDSRWRAQGPESDESDGRLERLVLLLRSLGVFVVSIISTPPRRTPGTTEQMILGGHDNALPSQVQLSADAVIECGATSGFFASRLDDVLRAHRRSDLLLTGWGLEGPVHSTLRAANDRGYECLLVPDACTPIDPELTFAACEMVRFSGGIFGAFANTQDIIESLDDAYLSRRT